ncbi:MAG: hypothetical protein KME26_01810 [Oscillatoria princeps RMCB-10]|nr:hypothetical protein [Oscillatoria princeps RMCB-10]
MTPDALRLGKIASVAADGGRMTGGTPVLRDGSVMSLFRETICPKPAPTRRPAILHSHSAVNSHSAFITDP